MKGRAALGHSLRALCLLALGACSSEGATPSGGDVADGGAADGNVALPPDGAADDAGGNAGPPDGRAGDGGGSDAIAGGDGGPGRDGGGDASAGCGVAGKPKGDFHRTTTDGRGTTRDYEVLVPASYDPAKPLALTFAFHGAGGSEADAKGYGIQNGAGAAAASIFVFPQGVQFQTYGVGWDDTCGGYDMVFFDHMMSELSADYCIDTMRVFAAGFSWGCDHVTALSCCRGDRIRAIGANACSDEFSNAADYKTYANLPCPAKGHTAIRFSHDASGGDGAYAAPLFATTSALYRSFNGCASTSHAVTPSPCVAYDGCTDAVLECPYPGLGHAVPAGWGAATWDFFATH